MKIGQGHGKDSQTEKSSSPDHKKHRGRTFILITAAVLAVAAIVRACLPWIVRDYVNRTLDRDPMYAGRIGPVEIHLLHGAYSVRDVRINKTTGNVPIPLIAAKR